MHWLLVLAQAASPDVGGQWLPPVVSGVGGAGLSTAILWKIHVEDRKTITQLTARLFLLADKSTDLGKTAVQVARGQDSDPELLAEMQRLRATLEERSQ
jgi:hypothetical protein